MSMFTEKELVGLSGAGSGPHDSVRQVARPVSQQPMEAELSVLLGRVENVMPCTASVPWVRNGYLSEHVSGRTDASEGCPGILIAGGQA